MIVKSLSRKSNPAQLIHYATRYITNGKTTKDKKEQMMILVKHNIRSNTVEGFVSEFKQNESFRLYKRKDSVVLFHTILSFSPDDKTKVSTVILKDLSKKFIELQSPRCLSLAVAHFEKQHTHIHVLNSGVQVNGRSARVSKREFSRILQELEQYQAEKYPQLVHSKIDHSKKKVKESEQLIEQFKTSRKTKKLELHTEMSKFLQTSSSVEELVQSLSKNNRTVYYRNGRLQGIESEGKKYRFSSLGFSSHHLDVLSQKTIQHQKAVSELSELRSKVKEKTKQKEHTEQKHAIHCESELEALQTIRKKVIDRDNDERAISKWNVNSFATVLKKGNGESP